MFFQAEFVIVTTIILRQEETMRIITGMRVGMRRHEGLEKLIRLVSFQRPRTVSTKGH